MNRIKSLFSLAVMMFVILTIAVILANTPTKAYAEGEQCYIVSIRPNPSAAPGSMVSASIQVRLDPQYIHVPKGSCVIFMNWVPEGEISVSFKEGKICEDVTQAPMKFRLDNKLGCYVTDFLTMGQTSSLRFMRTGDYAFDIFVQNIVAPVASGKITVY